MTSRGQCPGGGGACEKSCIRAWTPPLSKILDPPLLCSGFKCQVALQSSLSGDRAVVHDCLIKGLGMSSRVFATGHIKDPVPLSEKDRASCPGDRFFPPSFIH